MTPPRSALAWSLPPSHRSCYPPGTQVRTMPFFGASRQSSLAVRCRLHSTCSIWTSRCSRCSTTQCLLFHGATADPCRGHHTCLNSRLRGTVNLRWEWVKELRDDAISDIIHVDTRYNKADILTKCLDNTEFERQVANIQLRKIKYKGEDERKQAW